MLETFGPSSHRNRNVIAMPTGKAVTFFIIFDIIGKYVKRLRRKLFKLSVKLK